MKIRDAKPNQMFKIIDAGYGARGADGKIAILCLGDEEIRSGLNRSHGGIKVKVIDDESPYGIWGINKDAKVELIKEEDKTDISFDVETWKREKFAVHCNDVDEYNIFTNFLKRNNFKNIKLPWSSYETYFYAVDFGGDEGWSWCRTTGTEACFADRTKIEFRDLILPDILSKDDKMQILSAVKKWKNGEFAVFCWNQEESDEFLELVGEDRNRNGYKRCYDYIEGYLGFDSKDWYIERNIRVMTLGKFKETQKDDKIGISSCVDLESKGTKEVGYRYNIGDDVFFTDIYTGNKENTKIIERIRKSGHNLYQVIGSGNKRWLVREDILSKDDKKKILSDTGHEIMDARMSYAVGRNLFDEYKINFGNLFIGADFAKEYECQWIGKGEDMKKQTLFRRLGVERVWVNEEKRSVTVELINGNIGTAKADKNDDFCEQTGFSNAYAIAKSGLSKTEFKKQFEGEMDYIKKSELKEKKAKAIAELERKQRKEMQNLRKDLNDNK